MVIITIKSLSRLPQWYGRFAEEGVFGNVKWWEEEHRHPPWQWIVESEQGRTEVLPPVVMTENAAFRTKADAGTQGQMRHIEGGRGRGPCSIKVIWTLTQKGLAREIAMNRGLPSDVTYRCPATFTMALIGQRKFMSKILQITHSQWICPNILCTTDIRDICATSSQRNSCRR